MEKIRRIADNIKTLLFIQNLIKNSKTFHQKEIICRLKILTDKRFTECINENIGKGIVDLNACVLIPMTVSLKLCIYDGSWIIGKFQLYDKSVKRWIQIFIDYSLKVKNVCIISNYLYSNICLNGLKTNLKLKLMSLSANEDQLLYTLWKNVPEKFIKHNISKEKSCTTCDAIKAEIYPLDYSTSSNILCENYLKSYFQIPRFVCSGDIIEINVPPAISISANKDKILPLCHLKFLIENLLGEPLPGCGTHINSQSTILIMTTKSKLLLQRIHRSYTENILYIHKHIDKIVKYIDTCIVNSNQSYGCDYLKTEELMWTGMCLIIGPSGSGKIDIVTTVAEILGFQLKWVDGYSLRGDNSGVTEGKISRALRSTSPQTIIIITNINAVAKDKEGNKDSRALESLKEEMQKLSGEKNSIFILATTKNKDNVADEIWTLFTYHEIMEAPDFNERKKIINWFCKYYFLPEKDIEERLVNDLSHRCGGFLLGDFKELFGRIAVILEESEDTNINFNDVCISVITGMMTELSASLNLPKIPSVSWQDVGGLDEVKKELVNTIQLPILHPELISADLKRSGVLLYGPPGTGKTMLAKSVAHECGLNFMSVKGPELLDMYVGQSEANVREVFRKAREASPCVIFFDELDSLAPNRGRSGDSGGVMDRIVSALLAELDGTDSSSQVFVLGATNRPDLLDPALLRPGRFEKQLFINIAKSKEDRLKVMRAVFSKVPLSDHVELDNILDLIPNNLSGADFYSLAMDAFYLAAERVIIDIEAGFLSEDAKVEVTQKDIIDVAKIIRPSVTEEQLKEYEFLQNKFT